MYATCATLVFLALINTYGIQSARLISVNIPSKLCQPQLFIDFTTTAKIFLPLLFSKNPVGGCKNYTLC